MLNAWTIWWNADRFAHGFAGYWDAPIFHPQRGTFAFSEPQPATLLVAPIVWIADSPVPAYHAYLLLVLVLNAVFAVRLLRTLRTNWLVAILGGIAMLLHPLVHHYGDVLQLMPLWGVLWTLEALFKLHRRPTPRHGIELGIAFSTIFMSSVHHGLFVALLLGLTAWITIPLGHAKRWFGGLALATVGGGVILLPLLLPMHRALKRQHFSRQEQTVQVLSATVRQWRQAPSTAVVDFTKGRPASMRRLFPGWLRVATAAAGLLLSLRYRRRRRVVVFLAVFACVALAWSFGGNLSLGSWHPWFTLREWIPGFALVRSPYRFAYFVQLAVILLAALGLDNFLRCRWVSESRGSLRWVLRGMVAVLGVAIALEVPPAAVGLVGVPDISVVHPWQTYLREQTPPGRSIVCLPAAAGNSVRALHTEARWMLYGTQHGVPMVNGYSGFFPLLWHRIMRALREAPFDTATLDILTDTGVEFIVIQTKEMGEGPTTALHFGQSRLKLVFRDSTGVEIWRLIRSDPQRPL